MLSIRKKMPRTRPKMRKSPLLQSLLHRRTRQKPRYRSHITNIPANLENRPIIGKQLC